MADCALENSKLSDAEVQGPYEGTAAGWLAKGPTLGDFSSSGKARGMSQAAGAGPPAAPLQGPGAQDTSASSSSRPAPLSGREGRGAGGAVALGMPRRNLFSALRSWLHTPQGWQQLQQMLGRAGGEGGPEPGSGLGSGADVAPGPAQGATPRRRSSSGSAGAAGPPLGALPAVTPLEVQLVLALLDLDGDGRLGWGEVQEGLRECGQLDAWLLGGEVPDAGHWAACSSQLTSLVAGLRGRAWELEALLGAAAAQGPLPGWLTFQAVRGVLQAMLPDGSRDTVRVLLGAVGRRALVTGHEGGLRPHQVMRALGVQAHAAASQAPSGQASGSSSSSPQAALAVGWVAGGARDLYRLLRHHMKHNRAQVCALFPEGQRLSPSQLRAGLAGLVASRAGEPPLSSRE
ncbi:hypothetical protein V8C86DRAFT_3026498, partial [Haematococcus lacustris]